MDSCENLYSGSPTSLSPEYGNYSGYRMSAANIGLSMDAMTANQLNEAVRAAKQGTKAFEVSMLNPETASYIPKQHFSEIRALMKLTGVKPSVHGPLIDAAGFGERGWEKESGRKYNERRMFDAIKKAHLVDPTGQTPIVFHTNHGVPGREYRPGDVKKGEERFIPEKSFAVNVETGQASIPLQREIKFRPEDPKSLEEGYKKERTIQDQLRSINATEWENALTSLATYEKHADEIMGDAPAKLRDFENIVISGKSDKGYEYYNMKTKEKFEPSLDQGISKASFDSSVNMMRKADIFLENVQLNFNTQFEKAFQYGTEKQKKELKELSNSYSEDLEVIGNRGERGVIDPFLKRLILEKAIGGLNGITTPRTMIKNGKRVHNPDYGPPKIYRETEEFAMDKAAKTFGDLATKSYKEFGKNAPTLVIENWQPGLAFAKSEDIKKLIDLSRENFAKNLEKKGLGKSEAERVAENQIGVTWDLGRINLWKKQGFTDKDIVEQTKIMSKDKNVIKHVHLADNFGYHDSHLAPGMGDSPIKEMLEVLEKTGKLGKMRKILEAGGYAAQFRASPFPHTLESFGSPIYGMNNAPYWNQAMGVAGSYFGGYGETSPQIHHSIYGSGFTTLPSTFGGEIPGTQSRFGGTPMA